LATAAWLAPADAHADSMDPTLGRLVLDENCRAPGPGGQGDFYNPASGFQRCFTNDAAFAKLVAQLGTAMAPLASHPARTTGFGGYRFWVSGAYTTIDGDADYWRRGTQGPPDESRGQSSTIHADPPGMLQMYSLSLAKGFPFGLELGGNFGFLAQTQLIAAGGDVRIALFEGFRDSIPGYFPDLGVGGQVRAGTGSSEVKLVIASADAEISKPIHIAGTVVLQPHIGYQMIHIWGDSGLIDLTPNTDPVDHCNYQGDNTPVLQSPHDGKNGYDGQPACGSAAPDDASSADFNNNVVFDAIRLFRHRINFGMGLRFQMVNLGVHVVTDVVDPVSANPGTRDTMTEANAIDPKDASGRTTFSLHRLEDDPRTEGDDSVKRQWTIAIELGAQF
jgi:hypothetical protein